MTPADFDYLRKMLRERSGLVLSAEKQYFAESRLLPLVRRNGLATLDELIGTIRLKPSSQLATDTVSAMTTNETFFFRDKPPFENFRDHIMPTLVAARLRAQALDFHELHTEAGRLDLVFRQLTLPSQAA